jgi:hypothetical protein
MPQLRRYQTPNHGVSNEPPNNQEEAIRRMEEYEAGLPSQPRPSIHEESGKQRAFYFIAIANSTFNSPPLLIVIIEARLAQFLDEDDHKKCVKGNKQALQSEKLERLRALKDDIARSNWMFVPNDTVTSFSGWKTGS